MEVLDNIFIFIFLVSVIATIVLFLQKRKGKDVARKLKISLIAVAISFVVAGVLSSQLNTDSNSTTGQTTHSSNVHSRLKCTITSNEDVAKGSDVNNLTYKLTGKVNKSNTIIQVQGNSIANNKKLVKKVVKKGYFKINVPITMDDTTSHVKIKITVKHGNNSRIITNATIQNGSDSYKELQSSIASSQKASSESSSIAESNSIASSEAAASSTIAASEAAASSQKAYEKSPASYQTGITFDQLARTPDQYEGAKVAFTGKIVQVIEDTNSTEIRLAVNGDYDDIILVYIPSKVLGSSRVLEDDLISIYGISKGTVSYESTMGGKITVPSMKAKIIDDKGTASDDYGY